MGAANQTYSEILHGLDCRFLLFAYCDKTGKVGGNSARTYLSGGGGKPPFLPQPITELPAPQGYGQPAGTPVPQ